MWRSSMAKAEFASIVRIAIEQAVEFSSKETEYRHLGAVAAVLGNVEPRLIHEAAKARDVARERLSKALDIIAQKNPFEDVDRVLSAFASKGEETKAEG